MNIKQFRNHLAKVSNKKVLVEKTSEKKLLMEDTSGIDTRINMLLNKIASRREAIQKALAIKTRFSDTELKGIETSIVSLFKKYLPVFSIEKVTRYQSTAGMQSWGMEHQNIYFSVYFSDVNNPETEGAKITFSYTFGYPDSIDWIIDGFDDLDRKWKIQTNIDIFNLKIAGFDSMRVSSLDKAFKELQKSYIFKK
jgi:hypothetical protein